MRVQERMGWKEMEMQDRQISWGILLERIKETEPSSWLAMKEEGGEDTGCGPDGLRRRF